MKKFISILVVALILVSCNEGEEVSRRDTALVAESFENQTCQNDRNSNFSEVAVVYDTVGNAYWEYAELDSILTANGYTEIPEPLGWTPESGITGYSNVYFWQKNGTDNVEVYDYSGPDIIPATVKTKFVRHWNSNGQSHNLKCVWPGNECYVKLNGSDIVIICA